MGLELNLKNSSLCWAVLEFDEFGDQLIKEDPQKISLLVRNNMIQYQPTKINSISELFRKFENPMSPDEVSSIIDHYIWTSFGSSFLCSVNEKYLK